MFIKFKTSDTIDAVLLLLLLLWRLFSVVRSFVAFIRSSERMDIVTRLRMLV